MLVLFANRYCVLVGAQKPFAIDAEALTARMKRRPEVAADLAPFGIETGADLLKYLVLDGAGVDRLTGSAEIDTDDRAPVEFAELRRIGVAETFALDLALLAGGIEPPALARRTGLTEATFAARKGLLEAQIIRQEPSLEATFRALVKLDGARALAPRDQDVEVAIATLQQELLRTLASDYARILAGPGLAKQVEALYYARELHPDDPFLNQVLGAAFLRLERWKDAVPYLEKAAEARPDDLTFQSNLAYAYERSGDLSQALAVIDRLLAADPGNPVLQQVRRRVIERQRQKG
jgi:tetratricopeptide (TPR) repeat protein